MSQKRAYKQYSTAFKEEAVALVMDQGYSVPDAAKALGINPNLLYRWKEKLEAKNNGSQVTETEREECTGQLVFIGQERVTITKAIRGHHTTNTFHCMSSLELSLASPNSSEYNGYS